MYNVYVLYMYILHETCYSTEEVSYTKKNTQVHCMYCIRTQATQGHYSLTQTHYQLGNPQPIYSQISCPF